MRQLPYLKLLPVSEDVAWIDVADRLPEPKTMCLVYGERDGIQISYFTPASKFALDVLYKAGITHWMRLPPAPDA